MSKENKKENKEEKASEATEEIAEVPEETSEEAEEVPEEVPETPEVPGKKEIDVSLDQNTHFVSFFKTSKESEWQMFPKHSLTPEQAENRIKAHVSTVEILVIPIVLP